MNKYIINCFNEKDKQVYRINVLQKKEVLEKQIRKGYVEFRNEFNGKRQICYLNMYNMITIEEE